MNKLEQFKIKYNTQYRIFQGYNNGDFDSNMMYQLLSAYSDN